MSSRIISLNYSPLYSPSYQKYFPFFYHACCPHHVWTALPLSLNLQFGGNPVDEEGGGGGRTLPSSKKNPHLPRKKYPHYQIGISNTILTYSCSHWCINFFKIRFYVQISGFKLTFRGSVNTMYFSFFTIHLFQPMQKIAIPNKVSVS